jgi:hypothetical protein
MTLSIYPMDDRNWYNDKKLADKILSSFRGLAFSFTDEVLDLVKALNVIFKDE